MATGMELVEAQIVYHHHHDVRTRAAGSRRFRRIPASGGDEDESEKHSGPRVRGAPRDLASLRCRHSAPIQKANALLPRGRTCCQVAAVRRVVAELHRPKGPTGRPRSERKRSAAGTSRSATALTNG